MGKRSRQRGAARWAAVRAQAGRAATVGREDDEDAPGSPGSPGYYRDAVDDFHEARSRAALALAKGWGGADSGDSGDDDGGDGEEEVLALNVEEDGDSEDGGEDSGDGEDGDEDDGDVVGDSEDGGEDVGDDGDEDGAGGDSDSDSDAGGDPGLAWGHRKRLYYDTDYAAGRRSPRRLEEEEREEEAEARLVQRRLAGAVREDDVGLSWVQDFAPPPPPRGTGAGAGDGARVRRDLAAVSSGERLRLLRREAPELLELVRDLQARLAELRDELEPLLRLAEDGLVPPGPGSRYLHTRYGLYLNYCTNVCFYLILKARRAPVHAHPVIDRLVSYRNLINRLSVVDERLAPEIRRLLTLDGGAARKAPAPQAKARRRPGAQVQVSEQVRAADRDPVEAGPQVKRRKEESGEEQALEDPNAKRAITYQIAKNRGLTPRRRKIDRNPRVKHREKFRRANIRRRGQVRQVRREEQRYSGELSGIRAGVKKSIKLK